MIQILILSLIAGAPIAQAVPPPKPSATPPAPRQTPGAPTQAPTQSPTQSPTQAPPGAPRAPQVPPVNPNAPIRIEPPLIVLGAVAPRSQNPVRFTVRNISQKPVTIIESKSSCKCTAINSLAGTVLPPGGSAEIAATMDAPAIPGQKDAHIFVTYDTAERAATATIRAVVKMEVEGDPPFVDIRGGKLVTQVKVKAFDGKPFRIKSTGGDMPRYASVKETTAATKGEARIEWNVLADFNSIPPDKMMRYWMVEIDRDDCPLVPIEVRHELTGVKFDEARNQRSWMFGEYLANAGRLKVGQAYEGVVEIASFTPDRGQGPPPPANWGEVVSLRSMTEDGRVEMLGTDSHGDKVVVRYRFTPSEKSAGRSIYVPIELTTKSGGGRFSLAASVVGNAPANAPTGAPANAPSAPGAPGGAK